MPAFFSQWCSRTPPESCQPISTLQEYPPAPLFPILTNKIILNLSQCLSPKYKHCGKSGHTATICPRSTYMPKMPVLTCTVCIRTCRSGYQDEPDCDQIVVTIVLCNIHTRSSRPTSSPSATTSEAGIPPHPTVPGVTTAAFARPTIRLLVALSPYLTLVQELVPCSAHQLWLPQLTLYLLSLFLLLPILCTPSSIV